MLHRLFGKLLHRRRGGWNDRDLREDIPSWDPLGKEGFVFREQAMVTVDHKAKGASLFTLIIIRGNGGGVDTHKGIYHGIPTRALTLDKYGDNDVWLLIWE